MAAVRFLYAGEAVLLQQRHVVLQRLQVVDDNLPAHGRIGEFLQGGGAVRQLRRICPAQHVQPRADDNVLNLVEVGADFQQNAAQLFAGEHEVVGPLNLRVNARHFADSVRHRHRGREGNQRRVFRRELRPQEDAHQDRLPRGG